MMKMSKRTLGEKIIAKSYSMVESSVYQLKSERAEELDIYRRKKEKKDFNLRLT